MWYRDMDERRGDGFPGMPNRDMVERRGGGVRVPRGVRLGSGY
jgi:hypothetical protein